MKYALYDELCNPCFALDDKSNLVFTNERFNRVFGRVNNLSQLTDSSVIDDGVLITKKPIGKYIFHIFYKDDLKWVILFKYHDYAFCDDDTEQLIAASSHDLQEPLRKINIFASVLQKSCDEDQKKLINSIIDANRNISVLISDITNLLSLNDAHEYKTVQSSKIIEQSIHMLLPTIRESNPIISIPNRMPSIQCIEHQIVILFYQLLSNAIKFHKHNVQPIVKIGYKAGQDFYSFFIEDNGIGIEEQYRERIFGLFERLHTKETYSGTGIGLTLCKKIACLHGGKIWLESNSDGTTFWFTIKKRVL